MPSGSSIFLFNLGRGPLLGRRDSLRSYGSYLGVDWSKLCVVNKIRFIIFYAARKLCKGERGEPSFLSWMIKGKCIRSHMLPDWQVGWLVGWLDGWMVFKLL